MTPIPAPMVLVIASETLVALLRERAFDPASCRVELTARELHAIRQAEDACAIVREKWGYPGADQECEWLPVPLPSPTDEPDVMEDAGVVVFVNQCDEAA